jgi:anti-sigma factor RsiW
MNCQDFSTIVGELASISLIDAARRVAAEMHCEQCPHCAKRLAEERALVSSFRELRAADAMRMAPTALEDGLRAAFRQQMALAETESALTTRRQSSRFWWLAAAMLIATVGASSAILMIGRGDNPQVVQTEKLVERPVEKDKSGAISQPQKANVPTVSNGNDRIVFRRRVRSGRSTVALNNKAAGKAAIADASVTVSVGGFAPIQPASNEAEIVTDFVPLLAGVGSPSVDNGQVIRVQMPRSALATFGLPFNLERANESVKADVLMGEDGLARAIRFVQ